LPNDIVYADFDHNAVKNSNNKYTTLFLKQNGAIDYFHLRKYSDYKTGAINRNKGVEGENYLETGRILYDGSMMMSKVLCLTKQMQEEDTQSCVPTYADPENPSSGVIGTCCWTSENYLISYRKIDSRWINRINEGISLDFMKAIVDRNFSDNIGIIHWDGERWFFQGKISLDAAYLMEKKAYEQEHADEENVEERFSDDNRDMASWRMPTYVFDRNFFKDKNGRNMCERGCLFRIRGF